MKVEENGDGAGPETGGVGGWWGVAASQWPRHAKRSLVTLFSPSTLRRGPVELFLIRICRTTLTQCEMGKHCKSLHSRDYIFI